MKATKLERIYQETMTKGNDNPIIQYVTGLTLRQMKPRIRQTNEGHPINPGEVYSISKSGIFLIE